MADIRLDQINVVVSDVPAMAQFFNAIGVKVGSMPPEWEAHHRPIESLGSGLDVELNSSPFAAEWGGLPSDWKGVVLVFRVRSREAVDAVYERAIAAGADPCRAPYDAFWGARFTVLECPGGIILGIMSPDDERMRTAPPDPDVFARPGT